MISVVTARAAATAAGQSDALRTIDTPMAEPSPRGFTTNGISGRPGASGTDEPWIDIRIASGVGRSDARITAFVVHLSIAMALARTPEPWYGMPSQSRIACTVPSSPAPP